jgi:hypothetical protein
MSSAWCPRHELNFREFLSSACAEGVQETKEGEVDEVVDPETPNTLDFDLDSASDSDA